VLCQAAGDAEGFVTVRSPNWKDGLHANAFYLCIVRSLHLKSLRDLNASHLSLLKGLQAACLAAIEEKHGLARTDVHAYFHYQPSFFHLHVHFRALGAAADPNLVTAREYPLSEVIDNIEICSDYYQRRTLTFASIDHEDLTAAFARERKNAQDASLLIVLGYDRLEAHHSAKDSHLKVFLEFVFNHFHVALIAADAQKAKAQEVLGKDLYEQLQWCDSEVTEQRMKGRSGIIIVDPPSVDSIAEELVRAQNFAIVHLPKHVSNPNSTAPAMEESVFSHGEKLRKLLWACLHASAANIRSFIAIRNTYGSPDNPESSSPIA